MVFFCKSQLIGSKRFSTIIFLVEDLKLCGSQYKVKVMSSSYTAQQVVSKKRVADHGEVYTSKREVNAMLDLVKNETERIESRFLEPACGTGNFLAEILDRKLTVVQSRYGKNQLEYERYAVLAVSSLYGIDILEDNIKECQTRLFNRFEQRYTALFKDAVQVACLNAVRYILERNIIRGDALTLKTVGHTWRRPHSENCWQSSRADCFFRMVSSQRQHAQTPRLRFQGAAQPSIIQRDAPILRQRRRCISPNTSERVSLDSLFKGCRC